MPFLVVLDEINFVETLVSVGWFCMFDSSSLCIVFVSIFCLSVEYKVDWIGSLSFTFRSDRDLLYRQASLWCCMSCYPTPSLPVKPRNSPFVLSCRWLKLCSLNCWAIHYRRSFTVVVTPSFIFHKGSSLNWHAYCSKMTGFLLIFIYLT